MASRVVFPDPLGPLTTVTRFGAIVRLIPRTAQISLWRPWLKAFLTSCSSIMGLQRMMVSGSVTAARQMGTMVATV